MNSDEIGREGTPKAFVVQVGEGTLEQRVRVLEAKINFLSGAVEILSLGGREASTLVEEAYRQDQLESEEPDPAQPSTEPVNGNSGDRP